MDQEKNTQNPDRKRSATNDPAFGREVKSATQKPCEKGYEGCGGVSRRVELSGKIANFVGENPQKPVRIWVLDEHRYGLLPVIRRLWAKRGVRFHAP